MSYIIGISGPSGVGKTTIAKLFSYMLGEKNTLILSGDDSHKWDRYDKKWNNITHLNPDANNLEAEGQYLELLSNNLNIERRVYNHSTGYFDEPVTIEPKKFIIYEGLHTFYTQKLKEILNLKIYVDTDTALKVSWKLKRDIKKRGYSEKQVLEILNRRIKDEKKFILKQKRDADVVVKFIESNNGNIKLVCEKKTEDTSQLIEKLIDFYEKINNFSQACNKVSTYSELTQKYGGNASVKYENKILITSSGADFSEISTTNYYTICDRLNGAMVSGQGRPSMELDCHRYIDYPSVLHLHPVYINAILCSKEVEQILQQNFKDYNFVKTTLPGTKLSQEIKNTTKKIIFCQNHGIFIGSETLYGCLEAALSIEKKAMDLLYTNDITLQEAKGSLYPDHCIFDNLNKKTNDYIFSVIKHNELKPNYLSDVFKHKLISMEEEKHRAVRK